MATYKYIKFLDESKSPVFDKPLKPSSPTPHSGIYRCQGCRREIVSTEGHPLPPQNHHQHTNNEGDIIWKLIVAAHHRAQFLGALAGC
jgi:hypothetical protein